MQKLLYLLLLTSGSVIVAQEADVKKLPYDASYFINKYTQIVTENFNNLVNYATTFSDKLNTNATQAQEYWDSIGFNDALVGSISFGDGPTLATIASEKYDLKNLTRLQWVTIHLRKSHGSSKYDTFDVSVNENMRQFLSK